MKYKKVFAFKKKYFLWTIFLFVVELLIGMFVKDRFIRPYVGDFLVVILLYCLLKSFWNVSNWKIALSVLIFSFLVEFGQYFKLVELLGLEDYKLANIIIGTSFSWEDLLAYLLGIFCVYLLDRKN